MLPWQHCRCHCCNFVWDSSKALWRSRLAVIIQLLWQSRPVTPLLSPRAEGIISQEELDVSQQAYQQSDGSASLTWDQWTHFIKLSGVKVDTDLHPPHWHNTLHSHSNSWHLNKVNRIMIITQAGICCFSTCTNERTEESNIRVSWQMAERGRLFTRPVHHCWCFSACSDLSEMFFSSCRPVIRKKVLEVILVSRQLMESVSCIHNISARYTPFNWQDQRTNVVHWVEFSFYLLV